MCCNAVPVRLACGVGGNFFGSVTVLVMSTYPKYVTRAVEGIKHMIIASVSKEIHNLVTSRRE